MNLLKHLLLADVSSCVRPQTPVPTAPPAQHKGAHWNRCWGTISLSTKETTTPTAQPSPSPGKKIQEKSKKKKLKKEMAVCTYLPSKGLLPLQFYCSRGSVGSGSAWEGRSLHTPPQLPLGSLADKVEAAAVGSSSLSGMFRSVWLVRDSP